MIRCAAILLLAGHMAAWGGEPRQARVKWEDLAGRLPNRKIALVLPDGTNIEGKAIAVEQDGLRMKVAKTSNRAVQPKGEHVIPRRSVSVVRVTEYRKLGRLIGTVGAVGLAAAIVGTNYPDLYEGIVTVVVPTVTIAGTAGMAVGGYYAGKALDKRVTEILVEP